MYIMASSPSPIMNSNMIMAPGSPMTSTLNLPSMTVPVPAFSPSTMATTMVPSMAVRRRWWPCRPPGRAGQAALAALRQRRDGQRGQQSHHAQQGQNSGYGHSFPPVDPLINGCDCAPGSGTGPRLGWWEAAPIATGTASVGSVFRPYLLGVALLDGNRVGTDVEGPPWKVS